MNRPMSQPDPIRTHQRNSVLERKFGKGARCACGETRLEALISRSNIILCAACARKKKGQTTMDKHHVADVANSRVTVTISVNDHRAVLSVAQYDWPKQTLENPDRCPLLMAAACIRGFVDTIVYLCQSLLSWIAVMLEGLSTFLIDRFGPEWWLNTQFAQFTKEN